MPDQMHIKLYDRWAKNVRSWVAKGPEGIARAEQAVADTLTKEQQTVLTGVIRNAGSNPPPAPKRVG